MNSFLKRAYGKAHIVDTYDVDVVTVDSYCRANNINRIHFLKSDTEGFELNVFKGAKEMMASNHIQFIFVELSYNCSDLFNLLSCQYVVSKQNLVHALLWV